jgi:methionine-S-sulfoxide reductase
MKEIILGGGCFWCLEAAFQLLRGIREVRPGYAGGTAETAQYQSVCSGKTGHAEVVRIIYEPEIISLTDILAVFWHIHDPTTLNRQGNDIGPQYRSIIFYESQEEKLLIEKSLAEVATQIWGSTPVTSVVVKTDFFPAEREHENYYRNVGDRNPYCSYVVKPKVLKVKEKFKDRLINL